MKTIWNNIQWLVTGQLISRTIKGVLIVVAAHTLSLSSFGSFNLAFGIAGTFMFLNDWGLDMLLVRECAKEDKKNESHITALFAIKLVLLVLSGIIITMVGPLLTTDRLAKTLLPWVGFSVLLDGLRNFHLSFVRAQNKMHIDAINNIVVNSITVIIGVAGILITHSIMTLIYAYAIGASTGLLLTYLDVRTYYMRLQQRIDPTSIMIIIQEGIPLGLSIICLTILTYADTIIIGWKLNAAAVGLYAAPIKMIQLIYVGAGIIATSYLPLLSKHIAESYFTFKRTAQASLRTSFYAGSGIALVSFVSAPILIRTIFGASFVSSIPTFHLLLLSVPFVYLSTILGYLILVLHQQHKIIPFLLAGTIANLLLNVIFIGKLGIEGAAIANVLAQSINMLGYIIVYRRYQPVHDHFTETI
ncbi:MAG: flippase [Patescibacteria group bacterium]|nr:flippase [Patescibacteria group bacterium]MDE2438250.1 flippase [Patescibacteria group bacterium]